MSKSWLLQSLTKDGSVSRVASEAARRLTRIGSALIKARDPVTQSRFDRLFGNEPKAERPIAKAALSAYRGKFGNAAKPGRTIAKAETVRYRAKFIDWPTRKAARR